MENNGNGIPDSAPFGDEACERYLFGELSEMEQEDFEAAYFDDDAFFDRFIAVKSELLDLYARNELDANRRSRMERHFLATEPRRRRLAESKEFIGAVTAISERDRRAANAGVVLPGSAWLDSARAIFTLRRLAATFALLLVVAGGILILRSRQGVEQAIDRPPKESTPTNQANVAPRLADPTNNPGPREPERTAVSPNRTNEPPRPRSEGKRITSRDAREKPGSNLAAQKRPARPNTVPEKDSFGLTISTVGRDDPEPSITLDPGSTRSPGDDNTLTLEGEDDDRLVSVGVLFKDIRYAKYVVTVETVSGKQVSRKTFGRNAVSKHGRLRRLVVPVGDASVLTSKDYLVKLEGWKGRGKTDTIEEYYFRVNRVERK